MTAAVAAAVMVGAVEATLNLMAAVLIQEPAVFRSVLSRCRS